MAKEHHNRDTKDVLKCMRAVWKEEKMVNRVHQWCIVQFHGDFEGKELYYVKKWVDVIIESLYIAYLLIKNPLIKNFKNT